MALSDLSRGRTQRGRHRRRARHPEAALRRALPDRPGDPRAARAHHDLHPDAGAGRRRLARNDRGGAGDRAGLRRASRAGHRLRRRLLARGPCQRAGRRHLARHLAHEPRPRGQSRGSRLHGRARRHPRGSQPASARHRPVLPDRSRRQCQLGGMAATRASGTNAVRYGTMRDNVLSLTAVMADGETVTTGKRAKKSSAGYDLTRLLIGSEGTLGIITSMTLKLQGIPQAISGGVCPFPSVEAACEAVIATIQMGIPVARIELVNALQMRAMNNYSKLDYPETPVPVRRIPRQRGGRRRAGRDRSARSPRNMAAGRSSGPAIAEERTKLWKARHDAYWSSLTLQARRQGPVDRCLRADLAACRMHHRDRGRHCRAWADRADRRPCRRRQFPCAGADGRQRSRGDRG